MLLKLQNALCLVKHLLLIAVAIHFSLFDLAHAHQPEQQNNEHEKLKRRDINNELEPTKTNDYVIQKIETAPDDQNDQFESNDELRKRLKRNGEKTYESEEKIKKSQQEDETYETIKVDETNLILLKKFYDMFINDFTSKNSKIIIVASSDFQSKLSNSIIVTCFVLFSVCLLLFLITLIAFWRLLRTNKKLFNKKISHKNHIYKDLSSLESQAFQDSQQQTAQLVEDSDTKKIKLEY